MLPPEWLKNWRVRRQLERMTARLLGMPEGASRDEILRAVRSRRSLGTADALRQAPWYRRHSQPSTFEVEVETLWWNIYLLPWRARELEQYMEQTLPAWVQGTVKPCLW